MPKKLKELKQTDGRHLENDYQPITIEQVLGDRGLTKYGTLDENDYTEQLKSYNKYDLYRHATEVGLIPTDNRDRLIKSLVTEFRRYSNKYKVPKAAKRAEKKLSPELEERVRKIMSAGKSV